jgi:hypothetical protein
VSAVLVDIVITSPGRVTRLYGIEQSAANAFVSFAGSVDVPCHIVIVDVPSPPVLPLTSEVLSTQVPR